MKPSYFFRCMKYILFLAIFFSFPVANAYDFQVDGIYYNITSTNTVEVTYKDSNYSSYSGEVVIPCAVAFNNQAFVVTAVGDSAFFNSQVWCVTLPEYVTSIGDAAFYGCCIEKITCLSNNPPSVNNSFDYVPNQVFVYPDINNEDWPSGYRVLYVPEYAYNTYCESSMSSFFDYVVVTGTELEQTSAPSISIVVRGYNVSVQINAEEGSTIYVRYDVRSASGLYKHESWWEQYDGYFRYESDYDRYYLIVYAFAISDGKLPSDLSYIESPLIDGHTYDQEESPAYRGDVNRDGDVTIVDLTELIDLLLQGEYAGNNLTADVNGDKNVSISDVTVLIDFLLGGAEYFTVNGVNFTMVRVEPGTFRMGATEEQGSEAYNWEKPVHEVTLTSSYLIGETEVTQELWQAVMGANPSKHEGSYQKPVENVTWLDCQEFISRLNQLTGRSFRLPTEAEWEYAARGGNNSRGFKYSGSDNIADVGNVSSTTTTLVGSLLPNELYLYDMSGNVDEWVSDYWGNYTSDPKTNPTGPETNGDHVYRGGSWYSGADAARVSYRYHRSNTFQRGTLGLRLAL